MSHDTLYGGGLQAKLGPIANAPGLRFDAISHRWVRADTTEPGIHLRGDRVHVIDHPNPGVAKFLNEPRHKAAGKMSATLEAFTAGHIEFRQPGGDRHALVVPDASEPGRWRYSVYDPQGFASHSTFDSAHQAAAAAGAEGFTEPAPGSLDRLSMGEAWGQGDREAHKDAPKLGYGEVGPGGERSPAPWGCCRERPLARHDVA